MFLKLLHGPSWSWSYDSWIYNYLCNQYLSPLVLWVRISIRARCTPLCDKVCQWLATGQWFSPRPPVSSTNKPDRHDIAEILLKGTLNTIKQTNKLKLLQIYITLRSSWTDILYGCHLLRRLYNILYFLWLYSEFFIILYNILKIAELDCCQIIILSIYVPSTHAYTHVLCLSLDLTYETR